MLDWRDLKTKAELGKRYASLYPALKIAANKCGYGLAVHGSMMRDLDLMAMPWAREARTPETLMEMLNRVVWPDFQFKRSHWKRTVTVQSHGRLAYTLPFAHLSNELNQDGKLAAYLDVSVMPIIKRKK